MIGRRGHTVASITTLFVILAGTGGARAESGAAAEALFLEGKSLAASGRWADACPKFEESQRLDPGVGTLFQLANCHQHVAKTASAWAEFLEVAAQAKGTGQLARERVARDRAQELEGRLSRLTIVVDEPQAAGLSVTRDGTPVGRSQWSTPIPVDPGAHRIEASAPGKRGWSKILSVAEATNMAVRVPLLVDDVGTMVAAPVPPAKTSVVRETSAPISMGESGAGTSTSTEGDTGTGQRVAGGITFAAGLVGVGVGGVYGVLSKKAHDDADPHCRTDDRCDATGVSLRDDARRDGTIATVGIGVGAAAVVAGAVLWLTAPSPANANRLAIAPTFQGLVLRGGFR